MKTNKLFILTLAILSFSTLSNAQSNDEKKVYLVSNAHLDTQWNWDIQTTIGEYIPKTMHRNFVLFEKYPFYIFNFEGAVKYSWMKEYYPGDYELVKKYIAEGRWHVTGSSWDANDTNMPSPEAFSRNILYGQKFYKEEFGVQGKDIFLPDCFGFGLSIPTIAHHFGLIGFSTQKLQWRNHAFYPNGEKVPFDIGLWEGLDGGRIMMAINAQSYSQNWPVHDLGKDESILRLINRSGLNLAYRYFGTGDTGGSASLETMKTIEYTLAQNSGINFINATSDQLYTDFLPFESHPELPVHKDELLMDVHATGNYTSQAAMKMLNRRNELTADAAERSAVAAEVLSGIEYPQQTIETAWKRFIWHQFHDDLTGTSIPRAYEFSWNDELLSLSQFNSILTSSVGAVANKLDTRTKGDAIIVYNPSAFDREEVVSFGGTSFKVKVPAVGYAVYDGKSLSKRGSAKATISAGKAVIENALCKVVLDSNGDIASIVDKTTNREIVEKGKAIRLALFTSNRSTNWPAWEILKKTIDQDPVSITDNVKISIVETSGAKAAIKVERSYGESTFIQTISLTDGSARIDIDNSIDWASTGCLLKAEFPLSIANPNAWYDIGVGAVERGNNTDNKYEVYAHQWAGIDSPDGSYGVAVMDDSKYGWDKPSDNTIRLTLIHTPETGSGYNYQNRQDYGHHEFRYSILAHKGSWKDAKIVREAEKVNQPLVLFTSDKHAGTLGKSYGFVQSDNDALAIKAIKKAEDGDGYIVRVYETRGEGTQSGNIYFASRIIESVECDGNEVAIAAKVPGALPVSIGKFGVKTYRVKLAKESTSSPIPQQSVALEYNRKAASYNGFRRDGNFDGLGNSYAAELLPKSISFNGISFTLGDPAASTAMTCKGQTIELPDGNWNRLYLLASSSSSDVLSSIKVGDKVINVKVPSYKGFYGQWGHTGQSESYRKDVEVAYVGTHLHNMLSNDDLIYEYGYMFFIPVDIPEGTKSIILDENPQIAIFAATVASDHINTLDGSTIPAYFKDVEYSTERSAMDLLEGKTVVKRSGEVNASERAELALDGDMQTKWCDASNAPEKYICVDLGTEKEISKWSVVHAGLETTAYITRDFCLQISDSEDGPWQTVDAVTGNTENVTERTLEKPVIARFVKLLVTCGEKDGGSTARIYSFSAL